MLKAIVFPGQGSQFVGMGKDIYDNFKIAKDTFHEVNEAIEQNLSKIIFEGPEAELILTKNTQPALMTVSIALLRVLELECGLNIKRDIFCLAGHSLGEYTALTAANSLSLVESAKLLKIRGEAMQSAVPIGSGAMVAILGLTLEQINELMFEDGDEFCEIANDNCPGQVVVSGTKKTIEKVMKKAYESGAKKCVLLPVSAPFHCKLMKPAAKVMEMALQNININSPIIPIVANVTANFEEDTERIASLLVDQITQRVCWTESILNIKKYGVSSIIEIGAGKILSGLIKRISKDLNVVNISSINDVKNF